MGLLLQPLLFALSVLVLCSPRLPTTDAETGPSGALGSQYIGAMITMDATAPRAVHAAATLEASGYTVEIIKPVPSFVSGVTSNRDTFL